MFTKKSVVKRDIYFIDVNKIKFNMYYFQPAQISGWSYKEKKKSDNNKHNVKVLLFIIT